ncbi:WXG100 family type VII secretion target [Dactylosporangium sp. CA-152071]|uniref:WXG100 family type VII secretion target n=1 Tax=Dactylosporangium sp. CA-152071 TaxID=3239933 RepID=UPI003D8A0005
MAFVVTPQYLADASVDCQQTAQQIGEQLETLKRYVIGLRAEWEGVAATSFEQLMVNWDGYAQQLHIALTGIGRGLHTNYLNYVDNESVVGGNLQNVDVAMQPVRL